MVLIKTYTYSRGKSLEKHSAKFLEHPNNTQKHWKHPKHLKNTQNTKKTPKTPKKHPNHFENTKNV